MARAINACSESILVETLATSSSCPRLVTLTGAPRGGAATHLLTPGDDSAVGATARQRSHTLRLDVRAVPEPTNWALMPAGLGTVVRLGSRRR